MGTVGAARRGHAVITHVFFDFFGTLVDYDPSVHPANRNAPWEFARRADVPISEDESDKKWQKVWDDLDADAHRTGREFSMHDVAHHFWRSIGSPAVGSDSTDALIAEYFEAWTADVFVAAGALECVADLASDHTLAIVSNTHDSRLVPRLARQFGLHDHFDRIVTSVDVGWRKPHPKIYEAALRDCQASAGNAVFVGDNWTADVEGPRQAGMSAIYVGPPAEERPTVTLKELPELVRSLA
ncbi:HAD family hydrolase [Mycobacterium hippophais]|uniref:HAD family hydrolase n=1 Tax=Mycobacterium hippophais TaxID=3016340 RepID=UPI0022B9267F|nr:HAD family hydrolase [Mycobacterium hippophais]